MWIFSQKLCLYHCWNCRLSNNQNETENQNEKSSDELVMNKTSKYTRKFQTINHLKTPKIWKTSSNKKESDKIRNITLDAKQEDVGQKHKTVLGSTMNLIQEDAANVMNFICIGHHVWAIPLKVIKRFLISFYKKN